MKKLLLFVFMCIICTATRSLATEVVNNTNCTVTIYMVCIDNNCMAVNPPCATVSAPPGTTTLPGTGNCITQCPNMRLGYVICCPNPPSGSAPCTRLSLSTPVICPNFPATATLTCCDVTLNISWNASGTQMLIN